MRSLGVTDREESVGFLCGVLDGRLQFRVVEGFVVFFKWDCVYIYWKAVAVEVVKGCVGSDRYRSQKKFG